MTEISKCVTFFNLQEAIMKQLLLPTLIVSTLALSACCECEVPQERLSGTEQKSKTPFVKKTLTNNGNKQTGATTATATATALSPLAGLFALNAFADSEEGYPVGKGTLNYYDGDKIASIDGHLYHFNYGTNDEKHSEEGGFSQDKFDSSISEKMQQIGAKEFFNDIVPADIAKELASMKGFEHDDYMMDSVDFGKTKLRQFLLNKDDEQTIYQVISDDHHGEVGVFTTVDMAEMQQNSTSPTNIDVTESTASNTKSDEPFGHLPLNKSINPDDEELVYTPSETIVEEAPKTEAPKVTEATATDKATEEKAEADKSDSSENKSDSADNAEVKKVTVEKMQTQLDSAEKITLNINFDSAKATIREDNLYIIDQLYNLLHKDPNLKFIIQGHTDNSGDADMNQRLSLARAKEVKAELEKKGIESNRLKAEGYGEEKPIVDNDTKENRAKNRRVELVKF